MQCVALPLQKNDRHLLFLLFIILMSCVIIFLTLISLWTYFKTACVLSIFAQHQNSRRADAPSPGWWPRLKSFLHRQTSRAASPIASVCSLFPPVQIKRRKLSLVGCVARRLVHSTGRTGAAPCLSAACLDLFRMDSHNSGGDYLAASCSPWSAALQVLRLTIEENLWNLRVDSAAGPRE